MSLQQLKKGGLVQCLFNVAAIVAAGLSLSVLWEPAQGSGVPFHLHPSHI